MKTICLGLSVAMLLSGCNITKTYEKATNALAFKSGGNQVSDPQFTLFRQNKGSSKVWTRLTEKGQGIGDAGSSGSTAFGEDGCVRFRFLDPTDDFTSQPGVMQKIKNLQLNTNYKLSLYYSDKKGDESATQLIYGVNDLSGKSIATKTVHASELKEAPQATTSNHFRQTFVSFNSGSNSEVSIYAKLKITDPSLIDMKYDIGSQTEVRVDEVSLIKE